MIESILGWAGEHRDQAVFLVPLLALMETCVGVGLFVPQLDDCSRHFGLLRQ